MYEDRNPMADIGRFLRSGSVLSRLILINIGIWILISILRVLGFLFRIPDEAVTNYIAEYLAVPASLNSLAIRPWTLLTYMFFHIEFFHILFNMLWLFWFGKIFLEFLKERQLLLVYLLGGLSGGILYIIFYNIFPVFEKFVDQSIALGASASVMAIVAAISFYAPGYTVYLMFLGRIRIFYIAIALFVMDFFMIRSGNAGGHIAHIGGALFGICYIFAMRKGMNFKELFGNWGDLPFFRIFRRKKYQVFEEHNADTGSRPLTDEEYNFRKMERQKRIDLILDKVARSGYESLTREEKEILFKSSNSG